MKIKLIRLTFCDIQVEVVYRLQVIPDILLTARLDLDRGCSVATIADFAVNVLRQTPG